MTPIADRPQGTLAAQVATALRQRIVGGEFPVGQRLPGETSLAAEYGVSRVTVRTALRTLESAGWIDVRHGSGSYVVDFGTAIRAGIQELRSMSDTIREMGHEPSMIRHQLVRREPTAREREVFDLAEAAQVVQLERTVLADGEAVAFSYDVFPADLFPASALDTLGDTSIFGQMAAAGIYPVRAIAEVHAVDDAAIGWGEHRPTKPLYVLLDQQHQDRRGATVAWSRTYFVEGRFQFVVLRTL